MASASQPPPLPFAHPADIVRAQQKDEFCRGLLREHVIETLEEVLGHRRASSWTGSAVLVSDVAYFMVTSVLSGRTLGEEYCDLLAVTSPPSGGAGAAASPILRPSRARRAVAGLAELAPAGQLAQWLGAAAGAAPAARGKRGAARAVVASAAGLAVEALPLLLRLHLAFFYLFGSFRRVADRCAGIRSLSIAERPYRNFSYRPLGALLVAQVLGECCARAVRRHRRSAAAAAAAAEAAAYTAYAAVAASARSTARASTSGSGSGSGTGLSDVGPPARQPACRICLEPCTVPTCTPCGHLFCWDCIATSCAMKAVCPLCRAPAPPQQLLPLQHYEPPPPGLAR